MRVISAFVAVGICAAFMASATLATGAPKTRMVGAWLLSEEDDPFGDGKKMLAMRGNGNAILGVRCIGDELSLAVRSISGEKFTPGDRFLTKMRADRGTIFDAIAFAVDQQMLVVLATEPMIKELNAAQQFAFRFTGDVTSFDDTFEVTGAGRALADVMKACKVQ